MKTFFFKDHYDFIFSEEQETGAHFRNNSIDLWFKVTVCVFKKSSAGRTLETPVVEQRAIFMSRPLLLQSKRMCCLLRF